MPQLSLRDTIGAIRQELTQSILAARDAEVRFEVGEINLEFHVEIERSVEGRAGIHFWVVELGATADQSSKTTHRVSIQLKPVGRDGAPILTGAREAPE